ncbi:MAG: dTDP-4-dehydrorhamnose 3,5-epimerase family protein [Xanthobacteraceae bacterium]
MIDGAILRPLETHADARGSFTEFYSNAWDNGAVPAQWSVVKSAAGVLRGMHLHRRHDEGFLVLYGRASVGLRDVRPGSPTEGVSNLFEFSGDKLTYLTFPRGIVHGWHFHEPSIHVQSVSEVYSTYGEDDNLGCHWSDPDLDIPWPEKPSLVATRANGFSSLAALMKETLRLDPDFRY